MSIVSVKMKSAWYGAISAVSFTDSYIEKVIKIYDYSLSQGSKQIHSTDIQDYICGRNGSGRSDIRSTISLLGKMGFAKSANDSFTGDSFFNATGHIFALALKSRARCDDEQLLAKLDALIARLICIGISNAIEKKESGSGNMLILLKLFSHFGNISWDEYLYTLYLYYSGNQTSSFDELFQKIEENRSLQVEYRILKDTDEDTPVDGTAYLYNQKLLEQSGTIEKISPREAQLKNRTLIIMAKI